MGLIKTRCKLIENFRSVVDNSRGHSVVLDLPKNLGGDDTGATALELAVMGLAGCIVTIYKLAANKLRVKIDDLIVEVEAEKPDSASTITSLKATIKVRTDADIAVLKRVWEHTERVCPVGIIFKKAGLELKPEIQKL